MSVEYISADKLYKMIHCSKRKTKYLLDNGIIPCENTGKKTWRYRVKQSDVEIYLESIRANKNHYSIPAGIFSSGCKHISNFRPEFTIGDRSRMCKILRNRLEEIGDALTVSEAATATGYSRTYIIRAIQKGYLYAEKIGNTYIIPKDKLLQFLSGKTGMGIKYKSDFHKEIIQEFMEEKV